MNTGGVRPRASVARARSIQSTPASAVTRSAPISCTRCSVLESMTTPACTWDWPLVLCPWPRAETAMPCRLAYRTSLTTSSAEPGRSTASGVRCTRWP